jgi:tetratricopeptide (TPR) repeat protein
MATKKIKVRKSREQKEEERRLAAEERERDESGIQDEFQAKGFELVEWMQDNSQIVLGLIAAVIVSGALYAGVSLVGSGEDLAASEAYVKALRVYEGNDGASDAPADAPADEKSRSEEARKLFETVVKDHSGSDVATYAQLYVAKTSMKLGDFDRAAEAYRTYLDALSKNDEMRFAGLDGMAAALEAKGEGDKAASALEEWLTLRDPVAVDVALFRLAQIYAAQGNADKAKANLERLSTDYPKSALKSDAEDMMARLR